MAPLPRPWIASLSALTVLASLLLAGSCGDPTSSRPVGPPASIEVLSGDEQSVAVGELLPAELAVVVRDSADAGVPAVDVVFWYSDFENKVVEVGTTRTDEDGVARLSWRAMGPLGSTVLNAGVASARDRIRTIFVLWLKPGAASRIEALDTLQFANTGTMVRAPFFRVTDAFGNGVEGARTEFAVGEDGASVTGGAQLSQSNGVVAPVAWTIGPDTGTYTLTASIGSASATARVRATSGVPAKIALVEASVVQVSPGGRITSLSARVTDALDRAVARASVEWTSPVGRGDNSPQSGMRCVGQTDALGVSRLPCAWTVDTTVGQYPLDITAGAARARATVQIIAPPATIAILSPVDSGAYQAGSMLADSIHVAVRAADGAPLAGVLVDVEAAIYPTEPVLQAVTDVRGIATVAWRVPGSVGPIRLTAHAAGLLSPRSTVTIFATGPLSLRGLSAGGAFTCGIGASYPLQPIFCWGRNLSGELADRSTVPRRASPSVSSVEQYYSPLMTNIASGTRHACSMSEASLDVRVESTTCWGGSETGQVAGVAVARSEPVAVASYLGSVAAGASHSCGIAYSVGKYTPRTNWGSCWGDDSRGALGDGAGVGTARTQVVFPADAAPIRSISAGDGFSCSVMTDGRAYCWGRNDRGQLGDGSTTDRHAPALVGGGLAFDAAKPIAAGSAHACASRPDGVVFCWGANDRGQLGDGTTVDRSAPVQVNAAAALVSLAAGGAHSCGLTPAGAAYCWGANDAGQLGTGTFGGSHLMPEPVWFSAPLQKISTGRDHTCALAVSGAAGTGAPYCWGLNADGQLGDGTTTSRNVPTAVADFHP